VKRRNLLILVAALILFLLPVSVSAAQTGSLLIQGIHHPVCLYHVGDARGNFTEAFANCGLPSSITDPAASAKELQTYVQSNRITGKTGTPEQEEVFFSPLDEGLYLVCSLHSKGEFAPFLLTIPTVLNGKVVYHVEAKPKVEDIPPEEGSAYPPEAGPSDGEIPQTGISVIPKYALLVSGTLMTLAGLYQVISGKEEEHDD